MRNTITSGARVDPSGSQLSRSRLPKRAPAGAWARLAPWAITAVAGALGLAGTPAVWAGPSGPQGQTWASIAKLPNWQGVWQLHYGRPARRGPRTGARRVMPAGPDLLPAAQAKLTAYRQAQGKGEDLQPQTANCLPPGMPQIMTQPYPIEFLFNPGQVVILVEAYEQERTVFTDGRGHPKDLSPTFQGDSIGHWEGNTLVIDTVGFVPDTVIAPGIGHSDQMHIIERIHSTDRDHMLIETTIIDPKVLAKPWTVVRPYERLNDHLREYICEQNNRDSADEEGRPGERIGP